jgi:dihydrofolate reductase
MYLTDIDTTTPDAATFFPAFNPNEWREVAREHHPADAKHPLAFDFVDYQRAHDRAVETPRGEAA